MSARLVRALVALALVCALAIQSGAAAAAAARLAGLPAGLALLCSGAPTPDSPDRVDHACDCAALCAAVAAPPPRAPAMAAPRAVVATAIVVAFLSRLDARRAGEPGQPRAPPSAG